jgi:tetratricopeptide (TPR) repeat protein
MRGALALSVALWTALAAAPVKRTKSIAAAVAPDKQRALAVMVEVHGNAGIVRANDKTELTAQPGDLLFSSDVLRTGNGTAAFLYCPTGSMHVAQQISAGSEAVFGADRIVAKPGALSPPRESGDCVLPELDLQPETHSKDLGDLNARVADPTSSRGRIASLPAAERTQLERIEAALRADPQNIAAQISRAALLQRNGLAAESADAYAAIAKERPALAWARELVHETRSASVPAKSGAGQTYAVVIGISNYGTPAIPDLRFAHRDAEAFAQYLRSGRGGSLPEQNITLLSNEKATRDAIGRSIDNYLEKLGANDRLMIFISGHGAVSNGLGFLVSYRSNPANLKDSAYPMKTLTELILKGPKAGRVVLYVDACRAGHIGNIEEKNFINAYLQTAAQMGKGNVFAMMSSQRDEIAWEYARFGAGHGAFAYFLLRGLNRDGVDGADEDGDGKISADELIRYVRKNVPFATLKKQHPKDELGSTNPEETIADLHSKGIPVEVWDGNPMPAAVFEKGKGLGVGLELDRLSGNAPVSERDLQALIELENRGQEIVLKYLKGDEVPQEEREFRRGAEIYRQALRIAPGSLYLQARLAFFEGRAAIFARQYDAARAQLEQAIRIDPTSPSAFNALGIAHLEQARIGPAIDAFTDAIRRAPYWPYPRHNLALAYWQKGDYENAVATYHLAMALAPRYSYLPYNLGLLYDKMNRRGDAEKSYLLARRLADERSAEALVEAQRTPEVPEAAVEVRRLASHRIAPLVALGVLNANRGRNRQAKEYFVTALGLLEQYPDPEQLPVVRHNYALLLARKSETVADAEKLWRDNIRDADYLPSRISLAEQLLNGTTDPAHVAEGVRLYEEVLQSHADNVGIRLRVADQYQKLGRLKDALAQVSEARRLTPESVLVLERSAELHAALHDWAGAHAAYQQALTLVSDSGTRKRISSALARLP